MKISDDVPFLDLSCFLDPTPNQKLQAWGEGEWVDECNLIIERYKGLDLIIKRIAIPDGLNGEYLFGGHLCGYVSIPKDHKWYGIGLVAALDLDIEVHWGLTFAEELHLIGKYCFGFDCGHMNDVTPSMEKWYAQDKSLALLKYEFKDRMPNSFFDKTYRNMEYVLIECRSLADQILKAGEE